MVPGVAPLCSAGWRAALVRYVLEALARASPLHHSITRWADGTGTGHRSPKRRAGVGGVAAGCWRPPVGLGGCPKGQGRVPCVGRRAAGAAKTVGHRSPPCRFKRWRDLPLAGLSRFLDASTVPPRLAVGPDRVHSAGTSSLRAREARAFPPRTTLLIIGRGRPLQIGRPRRSGSTLVSTSAIAIEPRGARRRRGATERRSGSAGQRA